MLSKITLLKTHHDLMSRSSSFNKKCFTVICYLDLNNTFIKQL